MNNLSWLIYAADVVSGAGDALTFVLILLFFSFGVLGLVGIAHSGRHSCEDDRKINEICWKPLKPISIWFFVLMFLVVLMPAKQTVLMIATSELAENVSENEKVSDLTGRSYEAIQKFLDDYLEDDASE